MGATDATKSSLSAPFKRSSPPVHLVDPIFHKFFRAACEAVHEPLNLFGTMTYNQTTVDEHQTGG